MIKQKHRFKGHNSVSSVRGRPVRGENLIVFYRKNRQNTWRAAVVVSKKVHKSAVVRNRIRRRIYESLRNHEDQLNSLKIDVVIVIHHENIGSIAWPKIDQELGRVLNSIA